MQSFSFSHVATSEISEEERKIVARDITDFLKAWDYCEDWRRKCDSHYKTFLAFEDSQFLDWDYPVIEYLSLRIVEQQVAALVTPAMSGRRIIEMLPGTLERTLEPIAEEIGHVVNQVIGDTYAFNPEGFEAFVKAASIQGTAVVANTPFFEWDEDYGRYTYRAPNWRHVSPFSFAVSGQKPYMEEEERFYFIEEISIDEFKSRAEKSGDFMNVANVIESARDDTGRGDSRGVADEINNYRERIAGILKQESSIASYRERVGIMNGNGSHMDNSNRVHLLHIITKKGHVKTIAQGAFLVRDTTFPNPRTGQILTPYPHRLFTSLRWISVPNQPWGVGSVKLSENRQWWQARLMSQKLREVELLLSPPLVYDPERVFIDVQEGRMDAWRPHSIIPADDPTAIRQVDYKPEIGVSMAEIESLRSSVEGDHSMNATNFGGNLPRKESATALNRMHEASTQRLNSAALWVGRALARLAQQTMIQVRMYMPQSEYEARTGRPDSGFYQMTPEMISRSLFVRPRSATLENAHAMALQYKTQLYPLFAQSPYINQAVLLKSMFEQMDPTSDPDAIVADPQTYLMQMMMGRAGTPGAAQGESSSSGGAPGARPRGQSGGAGA